MMAKAEMKKTCAEFFWHFSCMLFNVPSAEQSLEPVEEPPE
jgi:hypothetical protein